MGVVSIYAYGDLPTCNYRAFFNKLRESYQLYAYYYDFRFYKV